MMLLPYNKEPATGSRIPSISTGGAAIKAMMKQEVAVNNVGINSCYCSNDKPLISITASRSPI